MQLEVEPLMTLQSSLQTFIQEINQALYIVSHAGSVNRCEIHGFDSELSSVRMSFHMQLFHRNNFRRSLNDLHALLAEEFFVLLVFRLQESFESGESQLLIIMLIWIQFLGPQCIDGMFTIPIVHTNCTEILTFYFTPLIIQIHTHCNFTFHTEDFVG
jgi:hypothetical protein